LFKEYRDKLHDDPEYPCCSCERLLTRNSVTQFTFDVKKFNTNQWVVLKAYLSGQDESYANKIYYVCFHCRPILNQTKLPARCVLNGLQTEPIPKELSQLNTLGRQLIQRAKAFQTIVRLGTYIAKVPIYNATRAMKGTTFFLPLLLENTIAKLDAVGVSKELSLDTCKILPDPELYILIDGQPTKNKLMYFPI